MSEIFRVRGTDRREELIEAAHDEKSYTGQQTAGSEVEDFSPETGFILRRRLVNHSPWKTYLKRAAVCARLSLGPKLELREFYYTLRQTPGLIEPFSQIKPETIYGAVLDSINDLEILADVDRDDFTMGNLSRGFVFDAHSWRYNDPERKVGFTETIARSALDEYEIGTTQTIIVVEKNAAATRLVEMGLSGLCNCSIVTVGGNFNRAIWSLTERFKDKKNLIFICDADVYGDDMLRTIHFGTMNSRHLPYKFPPMIFNNIHLAGLFPSIGERLGLPNDVEQKRPLNNEYARKRLDFLKRYELIDQRDIDAWERNNTYELEALSTTFKNAKEEPVGLGIYLVEYMRMAEISIKPPLPPDEELKKQFDEAARNELHREIREEVESQSPKQNLIDMVSRLIQERADEIIDKIYDEYIVPLEETLEQIGPNEIKFHIYKQFEEDPSRQTYDLQQIAHKLKTEFSVLVNWDADEIRRIVNEAIVEYLDALLSAGGLWDSKIEFTPIHNETSTKNVYDIVLEKIGAKPEDIQRVREALMWRFHEGKIQR